MSKKKLINLNSKEYEHPFDKKALNILEKTPGLEFLTRKFNEYWNDKLLKVQFTGSNLKVTKSNFPEIYHTFMEACDILCMEDIPSLYIQRGYDINAFTAGTEHPILVLYSGCIEFLNHDELLYIIGHELGHIKSEHVLYHQMAQVLPYLGNVIGSATLGIGNLLSTGIQIALLNWQRMSEFTADRAGLLTCQNITAATTTLIKIAGLPDKYFNNIKTEDFIAQAREFQGYDYDNMDKIVKILSIMGQNHPWTVMRSAEFITWIESGEYNKILNKFDGTVLPAVVSNNVPNQSNNIQPQNKTAESNVKVINGDLFCSRCGVKLTGNETVCPTCKLQLK